MWIAWLIHGGFLPVFTWLLIWCDTAQPSPALKLAWIFAQLYPKIACPYTKSYWSIVSYFYTVNKHFFFFFFFCLVSFIFYNLLQKGIQPNILYIHTYMRTLKTILSLTAWILSYIYVLLRKDSGRVLLLLILLSNICLYIYAVKIATVLPTKSDSDIMPPLQLPSKNINRSLVYESFRMDMINTQVTYWFCVLDNPAIKNTSSLSLPACRTVYINGKNSIHGLSFLSYYIFNIHTVIQN